MSLKVSDCKKETAFDWCALPQDVLTCLAKGLTSLKDYIAFRAVCQAWRLAASKENFPTSRQVPWLVLFRVYHDSEPSWRFHSLAKNKVHQPLLPFRPRLDTHICSSLGWMMTRGENNNLYLWHPLSHSQIQLPNLNIDFKTAKCDLSSSPSWTSDYTIVVIFNEYSRSEPSYKRSSPLNLALLKPGALAWTEIKLKHPAEDITYFKGQFYAVDCKGLLQVLDVKGPDDGIKMEKIVSVDYSSLKKVLDRKYPSNSYREVQCQHYVVESEGALLLVQRTNVWKKSYCLQLFHEIVEFRVFKVNVNNNTLVGLKSLEDMTLFFGSGPSLSVKVSGNMGCKANCIYFNMGCLTGIFHMGKEGFETFKYDGVHPFIPLPWLQQSF